MTLSGDGLLKRKITLAVYLSITKDSVQTLDYITKEYIFALNRFNKSFKLEIDKDTNMHLNIFSLLESSEFIEGTHK